MSGKQQHYLSAVLIGGFGVAAASGRLREATVAVRRTATGAVDPVDPRAESIASLPGIYRLTAPPPGIDRDIVDKLWDPVENKFRDLVVRLTNRRLQPGDDELLFAYAATAGVRHPSFADVAADQQTRNGLAAPLGDDLQYAWMAALLNQLPVLRTWRWRVLHSPADVQRFMISDRGWMYVGQEDKTTHGLLLPMGPRVAILGYLDDPGLPPAQSAFEEHLDLCQSTMTYLNAAVWDDPFITMLIAHLGDRDRLAGLPDHRTLRINALGPYRNRESVGLFDLNRARKPGAPRLRRWQGEADDQVANVAGDGVAQGAVGPSGGVSGRRSFPAMTWPLEQRPGRVCSAWPRRSTCPPGATGPAIITSAPYPPPPPH